MYHKYSYQYFKMRKIPTVWYGILRILAWFERWFHFCGTSKFVNTVFTSNYTIQEFIRRIVVQTGDKR